MLKRLLLLAGLLSLVSAPVMAAGTIPGISMTQQLDSLGKPLNGGKLYLIQAGTTSTPQNCYQDSGLTLPWPNPITLDSAGRIPQLFCADGSIKIRLTNSAGVQQLVADNLLVVGPSGGGGGGGSVDPTTVLSTGDFKLVYNTGVLSGFVRCNGRTIGSATSGATERANADTSALFSFLWNADANLAVSGGRGVSSAADFAANKTLTLPDCSGRVLAGLDDMGAGARSRLTSSGFGPNSTTLGATGGLETNTLTASQIPSITSANVSQNITMSPPSAAFALASGVFNLNSTAGGSPFFQGPLATANSITTANSISVTSTNTGGAAHPNVQPTILTTIYIKL